MTDNPELVATADLSPQSPKPINLSSPASVPALQDQADNLSTMTLSPSESLAAAGVTSIINQHLSAIGSDQSLGQVDNNASVANPDPTTAVASSHDAGAQQTGEPDHEEEDDYAKDFDSPVPSTDDTGLHGEVAGTDGAAGDHDRLKSEFTANAPVGEQIAPTATSAPTGQPTTENIQANAITSPSTGPQNPSTAEESKQLLNEDDAIDIQALVDNITASNPVAVPNEQAATLPSEMNPEVVSSEVLQSSLPPKPPVSQQPSAAGAMLNDIHQFQPVSNGTPANLIPASGMPYTYQPNGASAAAQGFAAPDAYPPGVPGPYAVQYDSSAAPIAHVQNLNQPQRYDEFLKEEKKYVSEAKWDRFPEGSRLFIGNLSAERVPKKEVFDVFSPYGRLAQISLKQAYGFVQYHKVSEGQAATDALQGVEICGRKIHLEISRAQKKDGDGDRRGGHGGRGGHHQQNDRQNDRHNNRDRDRTRFDGRRNEGFRPHSPAPSHGPHSRQGSYGRGDRGRWDAPSDFARRGRSRSPQAGYGGSNYRRRSPSPYRRGPPASEADLDIPRRYGPEVPDVQLLLLQEVNRDFVGWVQEAFIERGLKVEVMFLNPRFPRDLVIQRQVVEGVHGVAELDYRSQSTAKIPLQTFDRSTGRHNARFDQYQDLDPKIAAEIVMRARAQSQIPAQSGYNNAYYPPVSYPAPPHMAPQYPGMPGQAPPNPNLGGVDNATLQRVLSAVQGGHHPGQLHMAAGPGVDMNAVLSALGAGSAAPPAQQPQTMPYPTAPATGNPSDQAHVQNIMAQLSRYRQ